MEGGEGEPHLVPNANGMVRGAGGEPPAIEVVLGVQDVVVVTRVHFVVVVGTKWGRGGKGLTGLWGTGRG